MRLCGWLLLLCVIPSLTSHASIAGTQLQNYVNVSETYILSYSVVNDEITFLIQTLADGWTALVLGEWQGDMIFLYNSVVSESNYNAKMQDSYTEYFAKDAAPKDTPDVSLGGKMDLTNKKFWITPTPNPRFWEEQKIIYWRNYQFTRKLDTGDGFDTVLKLGTNMSITILWNLHECYPAR